MELVNKPIQTNSSKKAPSNSPATVELGVPNKVMKRSPPLLDAKLRLSVRVRAMDGLQRVSARQLRDDPY